MKLYVSPNLLKVTSAAMIPEPGLGPISPSVGLGISVSQPSLTQDNRQQDPFVLVPRGSCSVSPSCQNQEERTPARVCAVSDDCPPVSVFEMSTGMQFETRKKDAVTTQRGLCIWRELRGTLQEGMA